MQSRLLNVLLILVFIIILSGFFFQKTSPELITLFPIENYDQEIDHWIKPSSPDYDKRLLSEEQQKVLKQELFSHYYASNGDAMSPWNPAYIDLIFSKQSPDIATIEQQKINQFDNRNKPADDIGYGSNFRPYSNQWIDTLAKNINLSQFHSTLHFDSKHRGITVTHLNARLLPTDEVYFHNHRLPGEGYPFDMLQASVVWAGTPVYVLGETVDRAWNLILTPDYYIAWVRSAGVAYADRQFIMEWQQTAKNNLAAIANTQVPIVDQESRTYRFSGYVGMLFPMKDNAHILIPVIDEFHHASIHHAMLSEQDVVSVPLPATIHQITDKMRRLLGRPYGWGNMYYYNDCSGELRSLYMLFGIWLPRHSSEQVKPERVWGEAVDLSTVNAEKRIDYLKEHNHGFMTVVYMGQKDDGGHVFMYLGNYANPKTRKTVPLTYQNIWGFAPRPSTGRSVIGGSVLIPLLQHYPENPKLVSLADKKYFKIMQLDILPSDMLKFRSLEFNKLDLLPLMSP